MRRDQALALLTAHRGELERLGVRSLATSGSVARDEAGPDSDVEVLIDLEPDRSLLDHIAFQQELEELLDCKVDIGTARSLRPRLEERVLHEAVRL